MYIKIYNIILLDLLVFGYSIFN